MYLNDTLVTPSSNTYPFRAYVDTLLSYGDEAKNIQLTSKLWYKDTAGHMDATNVDGGNTGLVERRRFIAESPIVEMMGRLHVDPFLQDRFLLNGAVRTQGCVEPDCSNGSHKSLGKSPPSIRYDPWIAKSTPFPKVQCRTRTRTCSSGRCRNAIPQGAMSHTHENLFLGTLPKRLILWCIDNNAYNGEFSKNPFNAKNNAINFLAVYVDVRQVPAKPLQPNFEIGSYIRSIVNLFSATGKQSQDEGTDCRAMILVKVTPSSASI